MGVRGVCGCSVIVKVVALALLLCLLHMSRGLSHPSAADSVLTCVKFSPIPMYWQALAMLCSLLCLLSTLRGSASPRLLALMWERSTQAASSSSSPPPGDGSADALKGSSAGGGRASAAPLYCSPSLSAGEEGGLHLPLVEVLRLLHIGGSCLSWYGGCRAERV